MSVIALRYSSCFREVQLLLRHIELILYRIIKLCVYILYKHTEKVERENTTRVVWEFLAA